MHEKSADTSEGRTLFIRNLSFDVEEKTLYNFFEQFGPLYFAKIVVDPETKHSRGTAFVKFNNAEDASRVLQQSTEPENAPKFTLNNRILNICMAVSRSEASKLGKKRLYSESDEHSNDRISSVDDMKQKGRNLHLARIGIIRAGTVAAEGLSKEDLIRRENILKNKKFKLNDPNYFVSDTRLCVHNLPLNITDNELRIICKQFIQNSKSNDILECRVMRNLNPGHQQYRSLGYAFVCLNTHQNALSVLNGLNNNPNIFPCKRRPIVEFSLENIKALQLKERRAKKAILMQSKRMGTNLNEKKSSSSSVKILKITKKSVQKHHKTSQSVLPKSCASKNRHRNQHQIVKNKTNKKRLSRKQKRQIKKKND